MFKNLKILFAGLVLIVLTTQGIAAQYARPDGTISAGNSWSPIGAATLHEATDEITANNDTDYMSSDKFNTTAELSLSNVNAPTVTTGHIIRFAFRAIGGGNETCQVSLYQGAVLIASTAAESNTSGSYVTFSYTLSSGEAGAISDYTDLRFRITDAGSRKGEDVRVTWLEFEVPDSFAPPTVANPDVSGITADSAMLEAEVSSNGGQTLDARGTVWNTTGTPDIVTDAARALAEGGTGVSVFSHLRSGFPEKTIIYFRGYATNPQGTSYTSDLPFRTEPAIQASNVSFPVVGPADMTISWSRGSGDGVIVLLKAASAAAAPVDGTEYTANTIFESGSNLGDGTYVVYTGTETSVPVTNLTPGTTYYAAAYEYAGTGTGLTGINYLHAVAAPTGSQLIVGPPSVSTPTVSAAGTNSATLGATVDGDGGDTLTGRGTIWNITGPPILENVDPKTGPPAIGEFTHSVSGLPAGSLVYFRGYAVNSYDTAYSEDGTFYTEPTTQASGVNFTNVTDSSMTINWTAGSGDGAIVVARAGVAVNSDPVDGTEHTASEIFGSGEDLGGSNYVVYRGSGTSADLSGLTPAVTYHIAVFEYKGSGTGQGGINYKLTPATASRLIIGSPQVSTPTVSSITSTTATLGATVDNDGGAGSVTARGTVWNTTGDPVIANPLAEGGTSTGTFTHARTGLTASSRIYFRGYATNSFGTSYSSRSIFYTEPSVQASTIGFVDVRYSMMAINWTRGDGDGVIVIVRQGSAVNATPVDEVEYTASAAFGDPTAEIGTGNYVIYVGPQTQIGLSSLLAQTTYYVAVYEYKGSGTGQSGINYLQQSPATASQITADPPTGHNYTNSLECEQCHALHSGVVPRDADQITACVDQCHNDSGAASSMPMSQTSLHTLGGVDCGGCHEVHNGSGDLLNRTTVDTHAGGDPTPTVNQSLIRGNVGKYVSTAIEPALYQFKYTVDDSHLAFGETDQRIGSGWSGPSGGWDGVCQACHTTSKYHRNDDSSLETNARDHPIEQPGSAGKNCIDCHPHSKGFAPDVVAACTSCHVTSEGPRTRAIWGEFSLTSHHVSGGTPVEADCQVCHMEAAETHIDGSEINLRDPDTGLALPTEISTAISRNRTTDVLEADILYLQDNFCMKCHDSDGAAYLGANAMTPFSTGATVPNVFDQFDPAHGQFHPVRGPAANTHCDVDTMAAPWNQSGDHDVITCFDCHEMNAHGSNNQRMLLDSIDFDGLMAATDKTSAYAVGAQAAINNFCTRCHKSLVYIEDRNPEDLGSAFAWHGGGQNGHGSSNDVACYGCHAGVGDYTNAGYSIGDARGNTHGVSFTWPAGTVYPETQNQPTNYFMLGGFISEYGETGTDMYCGGGTCNHAGGRSESRF
jgi:hypothetical protein